MLCLIQVIANLINGGDQLNTTSKNRFSKLCVGVTLSLSMVLSTGSLFIHTNSAYAASSSTADQIISTGQQFMGVPYKFGAKSGRTDAFDCSSFTQYVYKQNGISLPRSSKQQSTVGTFVSRDQLQPGDLVFFYSPIHHVAIYMGNGKLLHTFGKGGVTITDLNSGSWNSHYATARRVLQNNGQTAATNSDSTNSATAADSNQVTAPDSSQSTPDQTNDTNSSEQNNQQNENQQNENQNHQNPGDDQQDHNHHGGHHEDDN